jgi:hypothetical protein
MKACLQAGQPFPDVIENAPVIKTGLNYFFEIWEELQYDRPYGMGAGPIPSSSIRSYLKDHEIDLDREDAEDIRYIVREMDKAWLRWAIKKTEKERIQQKQRS